MARASSPSLLLVLLVAVAAAVAGARLPVDAAGNATLGELGVKNGLGRTPQMGYFHAAIQLLLSPLCFFSFPCPVVDLKTFFRSQHLYWSHHVFTPKFA